MSVKKIQQISYALLFLNNIEFQKHHIPWVNASAKKYVFYPPLKIIINKKIKIQIYKQEEHGPVMEYDDLYSIATHLHSL